MRVYALVLASALGLAGCFGGTPAADSGVVDLQRTMKAMGQEWKGLNRSEEPESQAEHLAQLHTLAADAGQAMVRRGEQNAYEAGMGEFLEAIEQAQAALSDGDQVRFLALLEELDGLRKQHHCSFKP
ncbi:cytochrome b562 [Ferrimonas balearica]|uniref:cytochrome b562 n=1 Tax=Ferrimonas balearica TaxID=44012 RepID=UPI001C997E3C|nr:cytochrome b562 [Ferrimonas balearica]MBY5991363.1 hypothetical protein [Ferrimonas balearica]